MNVREAKSLAEIKAAREIRIKVFVEEQKIPLRLEMDDNDNFSKHVIALNGESKIVGCGRLTIIKNDPTTAVVSRIAILSDYRGQGVGKKIITKLEQLAEEESLICLIVNPHYYLEGYYTRLGYKPIPGKNKIVAHHPLIQMRKIVSL